MRVVCVWVALLMLLGLGMTRCGDPKKCGQGSNCTEGQNPSEKVEPSDGGSTDKAPPKPTSVQWTTVSSPTQEDLFGVTMPTDKLVWVVGAKGTILHSTDAGATWKAQTSGVSATLRGVSFINANNGWAVGDQGTIISTRDGGKTWGKLNSPVTEPLRAVQFIDLDNGFAVGDGFSLLRTSNGGDSWNPTSFKITVDLHGLSFIDGTHGYVVGSEGTILKTTNGAREVTTEATATDQVFYGVFFLDKTSGWAVGEAGRLMRITSAGGWEKQALKTDASLYGVWFGSKTRGWIVGKNGTILGTQDKGDSWQSEIRKSLPDLHGIAAASASAGVIVGKSGTILHLRNAKGECTDGEKRACYTGPAGTQDKGECKGGTQTCSAGIWGTCEGEVRPTDKEICFNDKDDDCDGIPDKDEDCPDCQNGDREACYTGTKETQGVGACRTGERVCVGDEWGSCVGEVKPAKEECNGLDDDCDGQVDNDIKDADFPACDSPYGVCSKGKKVCKGGNWATCEASNFGPDYEKDETKCDGKDNDCDGTIDEGCPCTKDGETRDCYGGPPGTKDKGECKGGKQSCTSGTWTSCENEVKPTDELCGDQKDNDCDGTVDEKTQYAPIYRNAHTEIPTAPALEPTDAITVEGWFRISEISTRATHALISKAESGGYAIQINQPNRGQISFRIWPKGGQAYASASARTRDVLKTDKWHHIAGTYDGTHVTLWIDGKKAASTIYKGTIDYTKKNVPLVFGAEASEGGVSNRFAWRYAGQIAQVRLSKKALYTADFTPDCMLTKGADTIGLWLLNDTGSGTTAKDETGNHDGTHKGAASREAIRCPGYASGGCKAQP